MTAPGNHEQKPAQGASSKACAEKQSGETGYICKACGGVSPVGVGFAVYGWRGVADESVTSCRCGYSVKPVSVEREAAFKAIWKATHKDFRGKLADGTLSLMSYAKFGGGLITAATISEAELTERLAEARRKGGAA